MARSVGRKATILIAEDSATQAEALRLLLEEHGFEVIAARNGVDALAAARRSKPDLIISDIMMPQMDGYALCRALKSDQDLQNNIPFILVTSLSSPHDVFKGLDAGADNFIVKPYDTELLLSRIDYLLTNLELRKSGKLQIGIEIELSGHRHFITAERQQILDLLISTYEQAVRLNETLEARQRELAQSYDTLNALYGFADDLNRCNTERDVAVAAVERGMTLPGVRAAWMYLRGDGQVRLAASKGLAPDALAGSDTCRNCYCHNMLNSGAPGTPASVIECERLLRAENSGVPRHATILLAAKDNVLGILNLVGADQRTFSAEKLKMLSSVGHQVATALERAYLHEMLERKVEERTAALQREVVERGQAEMAAREAGDRLREANAFLSTILQSSPAAITALDQNGAVVAWNNAAEAIFGYSRDEMLGRRDLAPIGLDIERDAWVQELSSARMVRAHETKGRRKDQSVIELRLSGALLQGGSGDTRGRVLAFEDLTERKRVEEQLRQAQKMEAIGNLTGGIAHDFNNLLTISIGNLDFLAQRVGNDPVAKELIDGALEANLRGADLTGRLLAFGRRQSLKPAVVDVNQLIRGMVTLLKRTLGEHITIKLEEGAGLWPVVIDAAQLDAAIVNLSVNARDAMADGGTLTIETSNVRVDEHVLTMYPALETGDYVVVSVTDTGTGMPPEVIAHVFEPFFTTKGPSKGTGLGLAMVYGFVKQSGGHVTVYSEVGTGTTFRLYLPRATSTDVAEAPAQARVEVPSTRQTECILVVEDNQSVRKLVARQLADLGYRVIVAGNADEGLAILESDALVDLVFSDVVMPGKLNGIKFAAEIAKRWPNIRVLLTSGFPEAALNNSGNTQHVSILAKPYRAEELAQAIRKLVATQPE